jgi:hypothetical protein
LQEGWVSELPSTDFGGQKMVPSGARVHFVEASTQW